MRLEPDLLRALPTSEVSTTYVPSLSMNADYFAYAFFLALVAFMYRGAAVRSGMAVLDHVRRRRWGSAALALLIAVTLWTAVAYCVYRPLEFK